MQQGVLQHHHHLTTQAPVFVAGSVVIKFLARIYPSKITAKSNVDAWEEVMDFLCGEE